MRDVLAAGGKVAAGHSATKPEILGVFIGFFIWFMLVLFLGKYLWNSVLIKLIPGIKPVTSVWQVFFLSILIGILKC